MPIAQRLLGARAQLGEGPLWRNQTNTFLWVDILAGEIHETTLEGVDEIILRWDEPVSSVQLDSAGDVYFTGRHALFNATGAAVAPIASGNVRLNDSAAAPDGSLIVGTMGYPDVTPGEGRLFRLGAEGVTTLTSGVTISNGIGWSADGLKMYYIDTPTQRIDVFDVDPETGLCEGRREWAHVESELGNPDGLCIDAENGVWVAMWGGGKVVRFADGQLSEVVEIGTPFVTCPTFVGRQRDRLVVTTASEPFAGAAPPGAGDVYIVDVPTSGLHVGKLGDWVRNSSADRGDDNGKRC